MLDHKQKGKMSRLKNSFDGVMRQEPNKMDAIHSFIRASVGDLGSDLSLDVGCGAGVFLSTLEKGIGIELGKDLAYVCKRKKLEVVVADANYLPFKDGIFALVTCIEVIEHVSRPYSMLHEIQRILKRRGRLFISTPNLAGPVYVLSQMINRRSSPAHRIGFDPYLLSQALRLTKFKIINLSGVIVARSSIFLPLSWFCNKLPNLATCIIVEAMKDN